MSAETAAAADTCEVLLAGVGGQGVLLASELLALAALAAGLEVKQSEVHGVAQRGGSVVSHVRFGARVHSPLVRCGRADVLYAAEQLEALRYAHYLAPGGLVLMDERVIRPVQLTPENAIPYPEGVAAFLAGKGYRVEVCPALEIAIGLGDQRCANVVLLGRLSRHLPLAEQAWLQALEQRLPRGKLALNRRALQRGRSDGPAPR